MNIKTTYFASWLYVKDKIIRTYKHQAKSIVYNIRHHEFNLNEGHKLYVSSKLINPIMMVCIEI